MKYNLKNIISTLLLTIGVVTSGCESKQITVTQSQSQSQPQPQSQPQSQSQTQPQSLSPSIDDSSISNLEKSVHQQINQYRASKNLPRLEMDAVISQEARKHSLAMAKGKTAFSHNGFEERIDNIGNKIAYRSVAENVAYNQGHQNPVNVAVKGWLESPGHYKNIIGEFNKTGISVVKNEQGEYYFTQIFVLSR